MASSFPRATRSAPRRRTARRTVLPTVLALALGAAVTTVLPPVLESASAAPRDLDDRKSDVERRIDKADERLDESSGELRRATEALLRARAELAGARSHLAQTQQELERARERDLRMQQRLEAAEARLARARADLEQGKRDVAEQEVELRRMVVASYQQGDPALLGLSMVLTTQDPAQLTGRMNANSTVANVESAALDRVEAARVLLSVREEETEEAKQAVAERRREAAANLVLRQQLEEQAREATRAVADLVSARGAAKGVAMKAKEADLRELGRLRAERERIERLIRRRASVGAGLKGPSAGILSMPVNTYVTSPFGWRTHPIWGYRSLHDGVDFGAACGTPVRAAESGTVIEEYYSSSYGNRLIIDHGVRRGTGVATISNHLSGYAVGVGERVERGETIGYVGNTGWSTGCHLHYTVLSNGTAVDPMGWF